MINKTKRWLVFLAFLVLFLFGAKVDSGQAVELFYPPLPGVEPPQVFLQKIQQGVYPPEKTLPLYIKYLYHLLLVTTGFVALGILILGGFLILFSAGDAKRFKKGQDFISSAILGSIILLGSYSIVVFFDPQLVVLKIRQPLQKCGNEQCEPEEKEDEVSCPYDCPPSIPSFEEGLAVYVEIPLGRLIEEQKFGNGAVGVWLEKAFQRGAEDKINNQTSQKELTDCLKKLTEDCGCSDPCPNNDCPNDPCDKTTTLTCQDVDLSGNLREDIEKVKTLMAQKNQELKEIQAQLKASQQNLFFSQERLRLAEALLRESVLPAVNLDSFLALKERQVRRLWLFEDLWQESAQDPATFYIPQQGNEDVISEVEGFLVKYPPIGPPPDPRFRPKPYEAAVGDLQEVQELARLASQKTGVRASLILALLSFESGYQQFPGQGRYPLDLCQHPNCQRIGTINCASFENLWQELTGSLEGSLEELDLKNQAFSFDIRSMPVSAAGTYCSAGECLNHCGGAMGPSQAMAFSWLLFSSQVKAITGKASASPWNFEDAFLFAGLHLKHRGSAHSQRCIDEAMAVWHYVGGHRNHSYEVVSLANKIASQLGEPPCSY